MSDVAIASGAPSAVSPASQNLKEPTTNDLPSSLPGPRGVTDQPPPSPRALGSVFGPGAVAQGPGPGMPQDTPQAMRSMAWLAKEGQAQYVPVGGSSQPGPVVSPDGNRMQMAVSGTFDGRQGTLTAIATRNSAKDEWTVQYQLGSNDGGTSLSITQVPRGNGQYSTTMQGQGGQPFTATTGPLQLDLNGKITIDGHGVRGTGLP
jgi:hypothetical protein